MSSTPYVVVQQGPALSGFYTLVTALVSTNTVINLSSIFTTILTVDGRQQVNPFPSVSTSISGNTFTITQANLNNVYVVLLVCGVR